MARIARAVGSHETTAMMALTPGFSVMVATHR